MIKIGVTGAIDSGKSTISRLINKKLNIPVFDADATAHSLYENDKDTKDFFRKECGDDIIKDGAVDRNVLRNIKNDPKQTTLWKLIEKTVHKRVHKKYADFLQDCENNKATHIIADIPFIFETGAEKEFDYTINVYLPFDEQKKRALQRETPQITEEEFEKRNATFMPTDERNKKASFTIDNSGDIEASVLQFRSHLETINAQSAPPQNLHEFNQAAVYVGSFDPMTLGHIDVVKSAIKMPYPKIYVAIGVNPSKTPMFSTEERIAMIEREMDRDVRPLLPNNQEIIVTSYTGLTVDFMKSVGSSFCIRGVRGIKDLEEENDLASVNKGLYDEANFTQAYFATSDPNLRHVSSSFARALCKTGKEVELLQYVSADVAAKMIQKRAI